MGADMLVLMFSALFGFSNICIVDALIEKGRRPSNALTIEMSRCFDSLIHFKFSIDSISANVRANDSTFSYEESLRIGRLDGDTSGVSTCIYEVKLEIKNSDKFTYDSLVTVISHFQKLKNGNWGRTENSVRYFFNNPSKNCRLTATRYKLPGSPAELDYSLHCYNQQKQKKNPCTNLESSIKK
jgi:hypothetical protein